MPILGMELCIGTFYQAGDADAFGSMNPRLRYKLHFHDLLELDCEIGWKVPPMKPNFMKKH